MIENYDMINCCGNITSEEIISGLKYLDGCATQIDIRLSDYEILKMPDEF